MVSDLQKIIEIGKKYIEVRIELIKLDFKEQMSLYLMKSSFFLATLLIILIIILFLALGLAFYLNELTQSPYNGFFIVAGVFFIAVLMLILFRRSKRLHRIFNRIIDFFIFEKNG